MQKNYHVRDAMLELYQRHTPNLTNNAKLKDCFVDDMEYAARVHDIMAIISFRIRL